MRRHVGLLHGARAAGVGQVQADADDQLAHALNGAAGRNRVHRLAVQHLGVHGGRHVDDRRSRGHGDRFFERADPHVGVDRRVNSAGSSTFSRLKRLEAGQRERHDVDARAAGRRSGTAPCPSVIDRSRLLDQHVARCFDGHARQHRARRVLDDADDGALRVRDAGQHREQQHREGTCAESSVHYRVLLGVTNGIANNR